MVDYGTVEFFAESGQSRGLPSELTWTSLGNYTLVDAGGPQHIYLSSSQTFKYFKVVVTLATDGRQYASLAEVGVFKN